MTQLLGLRFRSLLLELLTGLGSDKEAVENTEKQLTSFFNLAIDCVKEDLLKNEDILTLFEDLYECCQESQLTTLFPLFERAIHGSKADGSDKIQLQAHQTHHCTKICRVIMTKLTVTHDLQLRGALLRFVARTLPLTHPSGKKQLTRLPAARCG